MSRVTSDVETLSQFFKWGGIAWVVNGLVIVAVLITMFVFNWKLALVALLTSAPLPFLLRVLQVRLVAAYDMVRIRIADLLTAVSEVVMGAAVIRSYGTTESTTEHIDKAIEAERSCRRPREHAERADVPVGRAVRGAHRGAVVVVGVVMGPASGLTAGELVGFMLLVNRFLEPVAEVTEILDQTQTAVSGWRRVLDLLDTPIDVVEPVPGVAASAGPPSIVAEHVSFSYRPRPGSRRDPRARPPRRLGHDRSGHERRCRRRHRIGEDHVRQAAHPPRRPDTRADPRRRARPPRRRTPRRSGRRS